MLSAMWYKNVRRYLPISNKLKSCTMTGEHSTIFSFGLKDTNSRCKKKLCKSVRKILQYLKSNKKEPFAVEKVFCVSQSVLFVCLLFV